MDFLKNKINILTAIIAVVVITLLSSVIAYNSAYKSGFKEGEKQKTEQVQEVFKNAFSSPSTEEVQEEVNKQIETATEKDISDEIILGTQKFTVLNVSEGKETKAKEFTAPENVPIAREGAKLVTVELEVTNTTQSTLMFREYPLVDQDTNTLYEKYDNTYYADNSLHVRDLSPNLKEVGVVVYEIPEDVTDYAFTMSNATTGETIIVDLN